MLLQASLHILVLIQVGTNGVGIVLILQVDDPGLKETVSQYLFRVLWCVLASGIELR